MKKSVLSMKLVRQQGHSIICLGTIQLIGDQVSSGICSLKNTTETTESNNDYLSNVESIANYFGVSKSLISGINNGKNWAHL